MFGAAAAAGYAVGVPGRRTRRGGAAERAARLLEGLQGEQFDDDVRVFVHWRVLSLVVFDASAGYAVGVPGRSTWRRGAAETANRKLEGRQGTHRLGQRCLTREPQT